MEGVEAWEKLKRGEIIADARGERGMIMTGVAGAVGVFVTFVTLARVFAL